VRNFDVQDVAGINDLGDFGATSPGQDLAAGDQQRGLTARREPSSQSGLLLSFDGDQPVEIPDGFRRRTYFAAKRTLDIVVAGAALVLLSPLLLGITFAISVSTRGGAFFPQPRVGYGGKTFTILKFRTMYSNKSDVGGRRQASIDDDRVTPLGRVLRRGNLDELPQLLNIIAGDMSLVGPRPYPLDMEIEGKRYEDLVPYNLLRFSVSPGLSVLAQANCLRGPTHSTR